MNGEGGEVENHASSLISFSRMRFTKRISLFLGQTTRIHSRSLLGNPTLCRSYIVGPVSTSSPAFLISSRNGDGVTGLYYPIRRRFIGHTAEQFSDDEYECEFEEHKVRVLFMMLNCLDKWNQSINICVDLQSKKFLKMEFLGVCRLDCLVE